MTAFGNRIGNRLLVCPECGAVIWEAGRGRAFCSGGHGPRQPAHAELEMWAYVREPAAPVSGDGEPDE